MPVFLGDSIQWERRRDLFTDNEAIKVATSSQDLMTGGGSLFDVGAGRVISDSKSWPP